MSAQPPPAAVVLVHGPEELLADRAVDAVVRAVQASDPDADVRDLAPGVLEAGQLGALASPSLFGERTVVVLRGAQDLGKDLVAEVMAYLREPAEHVTLVLVHNGAGNRAKGLLDGARAAGAREISCAKITRPSDRVAFVRQEARAGGRPMTEGAARALVDSVGTDLRELAAAAAQLAADCEGSIDEADVRRYHTGRADVTSFVVADRAVEGRTVDALEQLRWALAVGVAPVLLTSALAQGLRGIAKVAAAARGARPADLARELGMPAWKIDRLRQQRLGWAEDGLADALRAVAAADAAVKGGGDDPAYALERAVVAVADARNRQ